MITSYELIMTYAHYRWGTRAHLNMLYFLVSSYRLLIRVAVPVIGRLT